MNPTHNQIPLLAEPQSAIDQIRVLWAKVSEPERMTFLDEVRRVFLFRIKPSAAKRDGQHNGSRSR